jgi:3-deoxy-D-manno-octulosonate 8-phosphate phosphatase (KDO 8-P phosphatase)
MIKLVILDVDGVLTDGRKYYDESGMPKAKTYCDKDFTAIKRLRGAGLSVCFLSGDDFVNKSMAKNRNIDFYSARGKDKATFVKEFESKYETTAADMAYVGDDLFDSSILEKVGYAFCPSDACLEVKKICGLKNILPQPGGHNVVMNLVELLLERGLVPDATMEQIEELDRKEKF